MASFSQVFYVTNSVCIYFSHWLPFQAMEILLPLQLIQADKLDVCEEFFGGSGIEKYIVLCLP